LVNTVINYRLLASRHKRWPRSSWPELIHPHTSAIDTPLPKPPEVVETALAYAANWVDVPKGKKHVHCRAWPGESLREWHERHVCLREHRYAELFEWQAAGSR
jgi:hypothetical protein